MLKDKLENVKETAWLAEGLTDEEVKDIVDSVRDNKNKIDPWYETLEEVIVMHVNKFYAKHPEVLDSMYANIKSEFCKAKEDEHDNK